MANTFRANAELADGVLALVRRTTGDNVYHLAASNTPHISSGFGRRAGSAPTSMSFVPEALER
ncbi:MAG TPA: hypothetical protein PK513_03110 [Alphaproteobacteria bacterium]|nr:hypothetical protein [Alphaproteobacteria bacterium]USO06271.1 MAG: hypothetical protein H6859_03505 [Rhodospirillales bacterium]HOO81475.1 hypothetical protein [Alphaproteobacteria bacterium]